MTVKLETKLQMRKTYENDLGVEEEGCEDLVEAARDEEV